MTLVRRVTGAPAHDSPQFAPEPRRAVVSALAGSDALAGEPRSV